MNGVAGLAATFAFINREVSGKGLSVSIPTYFSWPKNTKRMDLRNLHGLKARRSIKLKRTRGNIRFSQWMKLMGAQSVTFEPRVSYSDDTYSPQIDESNGAQDTKGNRLHCS